MSENLIAKLADAVQRMEGYYPGTRAYKNHNPGNIWDGLSAGKVRRIWPNIPIDDKGFLIFPNYGEGRAALERDLRIKVGRGMTLTQLIHMYAPPNENNTARYVANVAQWTGLPVDVALISLDGSGAPSLPPVVVAGPGAPPEAPAAPGGDPGPVPGTPPLTATPSLETFVANLFEGDDTDTKTLLAAAGLVLAAAFFL